MRLVAGVVDFLILSAPFSIWKAANTQIVIDGQSGSTTNPWAWLFYVAYFFVLEARWGASLGKRLFGLIGTGGARLSAACTSSTLRTDCSI